MKRAIHETRRVPGPRLVLCPLLLAAALAFESSAAAEPGFPAVVDNDLGLTGTSTIENAVAPHDGCLLCHGSEAGGANNLNTFGSEVVRNGELAGVPATLAGALNAIAMNDPLAIMDIKSGINPNDDAKWLSGGSASMDPVPEYGCGSVSPGRPSWPASVVFLSSLAGALLAVRKGRRGRRLL
jgi:hypothetical protein